MRILIFGTLLFLVACQSEEKTEDLLREPKETVIKDGVSVEVYDFEHIKPFLERDNDKVNVVNFWATWCVPCIAELPAFEKLNSDDADVEITLISMDFTRYIESELIPYILENNIKSDVILLDDPNGNDWIRKVDPNWSGAIPATIIYKGDKRVFYERSFTYEELKTEVEQFKN